MSLTPLAPFALHPALLTDGVFETMLMVLRLAVIGALWLGLVGGLAYVVYYLVTLPLRRQERARLFLSLVEAGLRRGEGLPAAVDSVSTCGVREMGGRFWEVAGLVTDGLGLGPALRAVPGFVPAATAEMVAAGERAGDLAKVLPACRATLADAASRVRGALSYLVLLTSAFFLANVVVLALFIGYVLPRFREMSLDMQFGLSPLLGFVAGRAPVVVLEVLTGFLLLCIVFYAGGPRLVAWLGMRPVADRLAMVLPWRRRRLQRDFSAMLAVLLDAGVPEPEAVALAAQSTGNGAFVRRAKAALRALEGGETLGQAVRRLDRAGEFQWRLANASHGRAGFLRALSGWHEFLEAKAFQQEQAAAHLITTALVLCHGLIVAMVGIGIFYTLKTIVESALLW